MFTDNPVKQTILILLIQITAYIFCPVASAAIDQQAEKLLKQTIQTLNKARNNLILRHEEEGKKHLSNKSEQRDFLLFISYLDGRIYHYCEELYKNGGPEALSETICPPAGTDTEDISQYTMVPEITEPTTDEKVARLAENFEKSLNQFDDMLLKEQEQIAQKMPKQRESSTQGKTSQSNGSDPAGQAGQGNKSGSEAQSNRNNTKGTGNSQKTQRPPTSGKKDLSQSDDDIVARQLKEAAEQETDPEVKAKLWEEYKKYKEGTR